MQRQSDLLPPCRQRWSAGEGNADIGLLCVCVVEGQGKHLEHELDVATFTPERLDMNVMNVICGKRVVKMKCLSVPVKLYPCYAEATGRA